MGASVPVPNTRPGRNSVGWMAAAKSLWMGVPSGSSRNSRSGMNTGASRAKAWRKSVPIRSMSGSGVHSGSADSTSVAPSRPASIALISAAAAVTMGSTSFGPGSMDSRTTPIRRPASDPAVDPAVPGALTWDAYGVGSTLLRGTVV